jgi:hypothetical protein
MGAKASHQGAEAGQDEDQPGGVPHHTPTHQTCHPLTCFLNPKVKEKLVVITLTRGTFKSKLEQAFKPVTTEEFAASNRRWLEGNNEFVCIGGDYAFLTDFLLRALFTYCNPHGLKAISKLTASG